jgi:hypothetical protein
MEKSMGMSLNFDQLNCEKIMRVQKNATGHTMYNEAYILDGVRRKVGDLDGKTIYETANFGNLEFSIIREYLSETVGEASWFSKESFQFLNENQIRHTTYNWNSEGEKGTFFEFEFNIVIP